VIGSKPPDWSEGEGGLKGPQVVVSEHSEFIYTLIDCTQWVKKTGPFLNVDNFVLVSGKRHVICQKVSKFCLEKSLKLAWLCLNILCLICINIRYINILSLKLCLQ